MEEIIQEAKGKVLNSKRLVALTGAGISAESGVPTFREKDGIREKERIKVKLKFNELSPKKDKGDGGNYLT